MSDEEIKLIICKEALELCYEKRNQLIPAIYDSVIVQLNWLIEFLEGKNEERNRLKDLTFGHYAVRELDPRETELVEALNKAFYVATKTKDGLKIDKALLGFGS